jgi:CIC family chloride channel protein
MDEPESKGAITIATREKLDNLCFIINCNLQRLDGPVTGNGKIINELEGIFAGAGWNVFTPTLFVGMALGMVFARMAGFWIPQPEMAILLGLTGMATLLAATTHAPIMATLMVCEMTGQYALLPGLLMACVMASVLSRTLRQNAIYGQRPAEPG